MPISLTNLPPELLTRIVVEIESQASLYNLALSSHHLYHFTTPHLYHSITIRERTSTSREVKHRNGVKGQYLLRNLTSLLIRKPDLARLVRHFTLHTEVNNTQLFGVVVSSSPSLSSSASENIEGHHASSTFKRDYTNKVDPVLKRAVRAWNLFKEEENDWFQKLSSARDYNGRFCEGYHDSALALLLPALVKVEKVILNMENWKDIHYLKGVIKLTVRKEVERHYATTLQGPTQPFEALTVFMLCPQNKFDNKKKQKHSINLLVSLLRLPAIREIYGGFSARHKNPIKIDSSSSSLTRLDLAGYAIGKASLNQILRAPKALKTLSYTVCLPTTFESAEIQQALQNQQPHLESLSLDYDVYREDHFAVWSVPRIISSGYFKPIESFFNNNNTYHSLKFVKIAALILLTTEYGSNHDKLINFFPPTLEILHLTRFQRRFDGLLEALEYLLASKSEHHIPSLKKLVLEESTLSRAAKNVKLMNVMWRDHTQETAMERLSRLAVAQGVSFVFIEAPPTD